jgi:hypothetical protein
MNRRRKLAKRILRVTGTSKLILKLYPLAVSLVFGRISKNRVQTLRDSLNLYVIGKSNQVRIGDAHDGGYILDGNLESLDVCVSFGIGDNMKFEEEISRYVDRVFLFDHTIEPPTLSNQNMTFFKKGLGLRPSTNMLTLKEAVQFVSPFENALLKLDIEGDEVAILANAESSDLLGFKQIVLELHGLHSLGNDQYFSDLVKCFETLSSHHVLTSLHANNWAKFVTLEGVPLPDVLELTFLRIDKNLNGPENWQTIDVFPEIMTPNNPLETEIYFNLIAKVKYLPSKL